MKLHLVCVFVVLFILSLNCAEIEANSLTNLIERIRNAITNDDSLKAKRIVEIDFDDQNDVVENNNADDVQFEMVPETRAVRVETIPLMEFDQDGPQLEMLTAPIVDAFFDDEQIDNSFIDIDDQKLSSAVELLAPIIMNVLQEKINDDDSNNNIELYRDDSDEHRHYDDNGYDDDEDDDDDDDDNDYHHQYDGSDEDDDDDDLDDEDISDNYDMSMFKLVKPRIIDQTSVLSFRLDPAQLNDDNDQDDHDGDQDEDDNDNIEGENLAESGDLHSGEVLYHRQHHSHVYDQDDFKCPNARDGVYINLRHCKRYYICHAGRKTIVACHHGFSYDTRSRRCLPDSIARC